MPLGSNFCGPDWSLRCGRCVRRSYSRRLLWFAGAGSYGVWSSYHHINLAGVSPIITHGVDGFVLQDPSDAVVLAGHLKNLLEYSDMRFRLGENARRTSEAHTWERNTAAV